MSQDDYLKLSFYRDFRNETVDSRNVDYYVRELLWLLPSESDVLTPKSPNIDDLVIPPGVPAHGYGGGGGDVEFVQLVLAFLKDSAVIVALISAITAIIKEFFDCEKDSEITIEIGDRKLTLKGPSKPTEKELIEKLFPELSGKEIQPAPSKLERFTPQATIHVKTDVEIIPPEDEPPDGWISLGK